MHISELWESDSPGPKFARLLLLPLSWIYAMGWQIYRGAYSTGLKKAYRSKIPVLCVGNLTVGGTGKSPLVVHIGELCAELGISAVISTSGYGSPKSEAATLAPDGELNVSEWGDESSMIRHLLPKTPLIVGRRRVLAAQIADQRFPTAVLLMDDGLQHLPLAKDLTILLDPPNPTNRNCLPAGPYREPRANRRLADLVIPGHFRVEEAMGPILDRFGVPQTPVEASLLCALAQPEKVARSLEQSGIAVVERRFLPDHNDLQSGTLLNGLREDLPILVTLKDWMKLRGRTDIDLDRFAVIQHRAWVEPKSEFENWLGEKLNGIKTPNHSQ